MGSLRNKVARLRVKKVSNLFLRFFLSAMAIMLIPAVIAVYLAANLIGMSNAELDRAYQSTFEKMQAATEEIFTNAIDIAYKNSTNPFILRYATSASRNYWTEYEISGTLKNSLAGNHYVDSCYLYLPQYDYIVAESSSNDSKTFFHMNYSGDYEGWLGSLDVAQAAATRMFQNTTGLWGLRAVVRPISNNNRSGKPVVLVTEINPAALSKKIIAQAHSDSDKMMVFDSQGAFVSNFEQEHVAEIVSAVQAVQTDENDGIRSVELSLGDTSYELMYRYSPRFDLTYVYGVPLSLSQGAAIFTKQYLVFLVLFCMTVTLCVCAVFAHRNYAPVKRILSLIGVSGSRDYQARRDEYILIENAVKDFIQMNVSLSETALRHADEFQELILEKLLVNKIGNYDSLSESLALYNIEFETPYFCIVLYQLEGDGVLFDDDTLDELERGQLTKLIIKNIATELFAPVGASYFTEIDDRYICIINCKDSSDSTCEAIAERSCRVNTFIQQYFSIRFHIIVSPVYGDIAQSAAVYAQLQDQAIRDEEITQPAADSAQTESDYVRRCIDLIHRQYMDTNLCVSSLSAELGLNSSYLSRHFKQQTGVGLLDFIHRYRLNIAKRLMTEHPNMMVKDVAEQTGFYNVAALIRVFKKLENTTPGQFRDAL